jgi:predicted site-specific integrase-resolvase
MVATLVEKQQLKDWYTIAEVARVLGKAEFTVREWARLGRIRAEERLSGRGAHPAWVVSHEELQRYQREGLVPLPSENGYRYRGPS